MSNFEIFFFTSTSFIFLTFYAISLNSKLKELNGYIDAVSKTTRRDLEFLTRELNKIQQVKAEPAKVYDFSDASCPKAILQILTENKKGLSAKEITEHLNQNGFETKAKDFEKVVYNSAYALKRQGKVKKKGTLWLILEY